MYLTENVLFAGFFEQIRRMPHTDFRGMPITVSDATGGWSLISWHCRNLAHKLRTHFKGVMPAELVERRWYDEVAVRVGQEAAVMVGTGEWDWNNMFLQAIQWTDELVEDEKVRAAERVEQQKREEQQARKDRKEAHAAAVKLAEEVTNEIRAAGGGWGAMV